MPLSNKLIHDGLQPDGGNALLTEEAIVTALRQGDDRALDQLVRLHYRELHFHALRLMRNEADAEELIQEAFLKAWRARKSFRGDCSVKSWLYTITTNLCYTKLKRKKRETVTDETPEVSTTDAGHIDALGGMLNAEQVQAMRQALDDLPPKQKICLTMKVYEQKSLKEIAEAVGSPLGTVKANIFHATRNLQKKLAPLFSEEVTS